MFLLLAMTVPVSVVPRYSDFTESHTTVELPGKLLHHFRWNISIYKLGSSLLLTVSEEMTSDKLVTLQFMEHDRVCKCVM
jgi:hypothetical protein